MKLLLARYGSPKEGMKDGGECEGDDVRGSVEEKAAETVVTVIGGWLSWEGVRSLHRRWPRRRALSWSMNR